MEKEIKQKDNKSMVVAFRTFQAIFYGVFALGISLMSGVSLCRVG